jgi:hypothetical protein
MHLLRALVDALELLVRHRRLRRRALGALHEVPVSARPPHTARGSGEEKWSGQRQLDASVVAPRAGALHPCSAANPRRSWRWRVSATLKKPRPSSRGDAESSLGDLKKRGARTCILVSRACTPRWTWARRRTPPRAPSPVSARAPPSPPASVVESPAPPPMSKEAKVEPTFTISLHP